MPRHSHISPIATALVLACLQADAQTADVQRHEAIDISVAASLRNAMDGIARAYSERRSGAKIVFNFGASGALQQQIEPLSRKSDRIHDFRTPVSATGNAATLCPNVPP